MTDAGLIKVIISLFGTCFLIIYGLYRHKANRVAKLETANRNLQDDLELQVHKYEAEEVRRNLNDIKRQGDDAEKAFRDHVSGQSGIATQGREWRPGDQSETD